MNGIKDALFHARRHPRFGLGRCDPSLYAQGFSLLEMVVAMAILGLMMALALPSFSDMMRNNQIRAAADALVGGLQQARGLAVSTNQSVRFTLTDDLSASCGIQTANAKGWVISMDSPEGACNSQLANLKDPNLASATAPRLLVTWSATEKGGKTQLNGGGVGQITFDTFGRANSAATININMNDNFVCGSDSGNVRCLNVQVSTGGQVRVCDPQLDPGATGKLGVC